MQDQSQIDFQILDWAKQVDSIRRNDWALTIEIAKWSDRDVSDYFSIGLSPASFVQWYAEKYDLIDFRSY